ncbi:MAG: biotin/lipoyl-binding protein [Candidatus Bipolaricaulota bacterium]|nr:biotin/lipoyl-binding protein [Candidatus Bipolaricaulota bacterium]
MDRLREIVRLLKDEDLTEITIAEGDTELTVRRAPERGALPTTIAPTAAAVPGVPSGTVAVTAPLVGTFYRRATPESPPLAEIGQIVHSGDTVCIIEAMKVMNEIKAEVSGRVRSVLAEDGAAVEYGQVLFVLDPL